MSSLRAVRALAWNTFLEAVRNKVLYLLLVFGVFLFAASRLLAPLALGQGRRVTLDLGFAAVSAFVCLTTIFVGPQLIFREVERKTIYFLFSRPLGKAAFVWGKYLGLLTTLAVCVAAMCALLALVLLVSGYPFGWAFLQATVLALGEATILAAVAVLLAASTSPVLAGLLTLAAWVIGHASADLQLLLGATASPGLRSIVTGVSWIVPRLDLFGDIIPVVQNTLYPPGELLFAALYAMVYATAALIAAGLVLSRRELAL